MKADSASTTTNAASQKSSVMDSTRNCHLQAWSTSRPPLLRYLTWADFPFRHFGREIIANLLKTSSEDIRIDTLWLKMYKVCIGSHLCILILKGPPSSRSTLKPSTRSTMAFHSIPATSDPNTVSGQTCLLELVTSTRPGTSLWTQKRSM